MLTACGSVLDDFEELKVATAYLYKGHLLETFPESIDVFDHLEVVYETLPGWKKSTSGVKTYNDLPSNAKKYIEFIERFVGQDSEVQIKYIGTGNVTLTSSSETTADACVIGPDRESMIIR